MLQKTKRKLIHFYTNGNIAEDFVASRRVKINKLRSWIKMNFYLHCAASLVCIGLSYLLGAGYSVIYVTVCALVSAWFALFAVGDLMPTKVLSCVLDIVFSGIGITAGIIAEPKLPFLICGIIMVIMAISAFSVIIISSLREYLEEFSPLQIRREDYTMLSETGIETENSSEKDEEIPPLPPLTSEMRELAKELRDILCSEQEIEAFSHKEFGGNGN